MGTDTGSYISYYNNLSHDLNSGIDEYIFVSLSRFLSNLGFEYESFFFICSLLIFCFCFASYKKLISDFSVRNKKLEFYYYISLGGLCMSPFFFAMQANILRQGLAVPLIFFGYMFFLQKRYVSALFFSCCAIGFHNSSIIFLVAIPLLCLSKKHLIKLIIVLSMLYVFELNRIALDYLNDSLGAVVELSKITEYGGGVDYKSGVRYDFLFFTSFFIWLLLILVKNKIVDEGFLKIYIVAFVPFLIFGFINFSDRLLVFNWFMIPAIFTFFAMFFLRRINIKNAYAPYLGIWIFLIPGLYVYISKVT